MITYFRKLDVYRALLVPLRYEYEYIQPLMGFNGMTTLYILRLWLRARRALFHSLIHDVGRELQKPQ